MHHRCVVRMAILADPSNRLANFDGRSTHMEVVPLALELGRGVDLVGHDASDGLQEYVSLECFI